MTAIPPEPIRGQFKGKDVISLGQFDTDSIAKLFHITAQMREVALSAAPSHVLDGSIVVLLFYEPSSRTMGSFDAATKQLGGQTVVVTSPQQYSSVAKGESFADTIRTFEAYSDAIVLRHYETGSAATAAETARHVPILNAGDGIGEHPTQALLDLYTIWEHTGRLAGLRGLVAGDILNGRTVHSLIKGLALYEENELYLLAPPELRLARDDLAAFQQSGIRLYEVDDVGDIPRDCHFWYWTRVQKERFRSDEEFQRVNNRFIVTKQLLETYGNRDMILMHPLPRVGEIEDAVDDDLRAVYLRSQIRNGMYVRMALLALVLGRIA
ncbi:MAG: aspartate carbamoyltransferase [Chloroflexi bacterium]|nr:aspartate carbamoyltransferase [Chloroflexota bacterium]